MKRLSILILILGIAAVVAVVISADAAAVWAAVLRAGWASLLVIAIRGVEVGLAGIAWWRLFPEQVRPRAGVAVLLRFVREGANTLLPLTQVGGDVIGARLLTFWGVAGTLAAASVIVDLLVEAATQFLFALAGLAVLLGHSRAGAVVPTVAAGLAIALPALLGFYLAQRRWGHFVVSRLLRRLARSGEWRIHGTVDELYGRLRGLYAHRRGIAAGAAIHLVVWFAGALEVWAALAAMGYHIGYPAALAIESLAQATRSAAFLVPGALGVQEGGLIVLCALFGVPEQSALAMSLIKRAADIVVGAPGLVVWQGLEAGRWRTPRARPALFSPRDGGLR
jgi:putative membrane protein